MKDKKLLWTIVSVVGVVGVIVALFLNTWSMMIGEEVLETVGMFGSFDKATISIFDAVGDKTFVALWSVLVYVLAIVLVIAVVLGIVAMLLKTNKKNKKAISLITKICAFVSIIAAILISVCGSINCIANNVAGKLTEIVYKVVANEGFYILAVGAVLSSMGLTFASKK